MLIEYAEREWNNKPHFGETPPKIIGEITKHARVAENGLTKQLRTSQETKKSLEGGGTVLIPEGVFSSGALYLKENVHLKVSKGGRLRGIAGNENYPTLEKTRIAGLTIDWPSAFINAINTENVKFFGGGTIDGSGYYWWEDYWDARDSLSKTIHSDLIDWHVPRPRLVLFDSVSVSSIENINLQNSSSSSFREAVGKPNRMVVFKVGGVINIASRIMVAPNIGRSRLVFLS